MLPVIDCLPPWGFGKKPKNPRRDGLGLVIAIAIGPCLHTVASSEDGATFAAVQAAQAQKEVDKILAQNKSAGLVFQPGVPTTEHALHLTADMKAALDAVKIQAAITIGRGNIMEGPDTKKACPSQLFNKGDRNQGGCSSNLEQAGLLSKDAPVLASEKNQIWVFVSFSMPEASLKSLGKEAQQNNAVLVMRGLYEDSFVKTANKLKEIGIGVDINPELFEEHHVTVIPTFVLVKSGQPVGRLKGNVTLEFAARKFQERLRESAP